MSGDDDDLFLWTVHEHVRRGDPRTSLAAAESVQDRVTVVQQRVLEIHADFDGLTDEELTAEYVRRYGVTGQSSIRSRRHDLTRAGRFEDSGERRELKTGRMGIVWRRIAR